MYDKDLVYLRVEGDKVTGSYGSFLTRDELTNVEYIKVKLWEQKPATIGWNLVFVMSLALLTIQSTAPEERVTWPIYKAFGDFTVLVVLGGILLGIHLILKRRRINQNIPNTFIRIKRNDSWTNVLITNDEKWAIEVTNKLKRLGEPGTGDMEFYSLEKRVSQIQ